MSRPRHPFTVLHQERQRILLRALEEMNADKETTAESAMITEMIAELEELLARRRRRRRIDTTRRRSSFLVLMERRQRERELQSILMPLA